MSISTESDSENPLYCELCNFISFNSFVEFEKHHLKHIRQPLIRLVKLNPKLYVKLQKRSYEVNTGVARRSFQFDHVPPLKISVVNQQGLKQFQVINQERTPSSSNSPSTDYSSGSNYREETKAKVSHKGHNSSVETEGTNLLERFGANISVSRKSKSMPQTLCKATVENADGNGKRESEISQAVLDSKKDPLLERLSGIGGISISKSKSSANGTVEAKQSSQAIFPKPNQISVSTKEKSIDLNQLIKLKDQDEDEKKTFDKNKILEKLSGSGLICIAPKCQSKSDSEKTEGSEVITKENADGSCNKNPRARLDRLGSIKSDDSNDSAEDFKAVNVDQTILVNRSGEEDKAKVLNGNGSESGGLKRFVRVKNSTFSKKNIRPDKHNSLDDSFASEERTGAVKENCVRESGKDIIDTLIEEKTGSPEEFTENCSTESGRDILERLTDSLSNSVAAEKTERSAEVENSDVSRSVRMESPVLSAISSGEGELPDNSLVSTYGSDQQSQKDSLMAPSSTVSNDQPQQDPLMTPDNPVSNGEDINPSFLHNFLDEHHPPSSLQPDNSEFMSLDGLAQTQHHLAPNVGPSFDLNPSETNTPMEQLSQQVQRIPNTINVLSQHHMQAPQPPQLHTGVPISPQHISPQQPNSYEALSHMQPPMPPPPLYQGFNMFNQNYQPQTPQMPRPPMLQQRPQIQPRPFQSMAAPPRQRSRVTKRPIVRMPPSQEIMMPKQRRLDPPLQARPQIQNATAKLPSGITVTPPRKAVEANKAANVLASRGITVTPSVSRQKSNLPASLLNIGSGISITSSNQNRNNNGGFAVPARKGNAPIVNNHLERPERCTTVDLTKDDEPSHAARNRMGKFSCKVCQKIFTSSVALETHKAYHRSPASTLPFKCDKCSAEYSASAYLERHKYTFHKVKQAGPDLAIPIVDLNFPGAKDQLLKCGVSNFIPLSQLQSNNNGYFGLPIIQLDMTKEKAMSNLSALGAGNVFVLGKMKALAPCINH